MMNEHGTAMSGFVFRDEHLQAFVLGRPRAGSSSESKVSTADAMVRELRDAVKRKAVPHAIHRMTALLDSAVPVPDSVCACFVSHVIAPMVPSIAYPLVSADAILAAPALHLVFERARQNGNRALTLSSGEKLYRLYEGSDKFENARRVLAVMLRIYTEADNAHEIARITNNYGYEYLLEGRFDRAASCFADARSLFAHMGNEWEADNASANLLTCQFSTYPPRYWNKYLIPELKRLDALFPGPSEFRSRKTGMLLARHAEHRGNISAAIKRADRAIRVTKDMRTRHHLEDGIYLSRLRNRRFSELHEGAGRQITA